MITTTQPKIKLVCPHNWRFLKATTKEDRVYLIFYCKLCLKTKIKKLRQGITADLLKS